MPEGPRRDILRCTGRSYLLRGLGLRRSAPWKLAPRQRGASLAGSSEPPAPGHGGFQVGLASPERTGRRPGEARSPLGAPTPRKERFLLSLGSGAFLPRLRGSPLGLRGFGLGLPLVNRFKNVFFVVE